MPDHKSCVLVADDEAGTREMLALWLRCQDCVPLNAADGQEALALAAKCPLDLALVDVRMPGPAGIELVTRLRALQPHLPVILVTAFGSTELAVEAMHRGVFYYLDKPIDRSLFGQVVERALALRVTQAPLKPARRDATEDLSPRQQQVLRLLCRGLTNKEIAADLGLSAKTVEHHVSAVLRKLEVASRVEAALVAQRRGWLGGQKDGGDEGDAL